MSDPELDAMNTVYGALQDLEESARGRVLNWAASRFEIAEVAPAAGGQTSSEADPEVAAFQDVGDVIEAAGPTSGPERALVVAYWLQEIEGKVAGWGGREVNDVLKNIGHGLANVTKTLDSLKNRRPQLVMQVGKSGRSHQSRKTYKLTTAGLAAVREMFDRQRTEAA